VISNDATAASTHKAEEEHARRCVGWTKGDGSSTEGYNAADYFRDGVYLGPDEHGIEPIFETV
jgi:hypothetical protein